jgi:hypothetical protein
MLSGPTHANASPVTLEPQAPFRAWERALARVPAWGWLAVIVAVSALFRVVNAQASSTPWILPDEYVYAELARSLGESGNFVVNGDPMATWSYGPLYALVLAPVWLLTSSAAAAYTVAQVVNGLLMSSAAVFAYLLGRRALDRRSAIFLAVLTVLVPSMVYSTKMMTESLAYPAFLAAVLAIARMLERPSAARQLVALLAIGLAALTRVEMVALLPALALAIVLVAALLPVPGTDSRPAFAHRLARFRLTLIVLGAGAAAAMSALVLKPGVLGGHARWLDAFDPGAVPRWVLIYLGDLDLYVGIVPFAAFLLTVGLALRSGLPDRARSIMLLSGSVFVSFVLFIACYSTGPRAADAVQDRHLFYVVPLELLAFLLWIHAGLPRPRRLTLAAAAVAAIAPVFIPFSHVLTGRAWGVSSSTVALVPWATLKPQLGSAGTITIVVLGLAAAAVAAFVFVPARRAAVLCTIVIANFMFITLFVLAANIAVAKKGRERWVAPNPDWIANAVGRESRVVGIWAVSDEGLTTAAQDRVYALIENGFINPRVRIYAYGEAYEILKVWPPIVDEIGVGADGSLGEDGVPVHADFALVGPELPVQGTEVARDPNSGLILYRLEGSELRLR